MDNNLGRVVDTVGSSIVTCATLHAVTTAYSTPEPLVNIVEDVLPQYERGNGAAGGCLGWLLSEGAIIVGPFVYGIATDQPVFAAPLLAKIATNLLSALYSKTESYKDRRLDYCLKNNLSINWRTRWNWQENHDWASEKK